MKRVTRAGVVGCVCIAVILGLVYFVRAIDLLGDTASTNASLNYDDREFAGGNSLVVDKRLLYQARALIPADGRYRIVLGPGVEGATQLANSYFDQFARSFLMPRRPATDAEWILCHGCDPSSLDRPADVVWDNGAGISILKTTG